MSLILASPLLFSNMMFSNFTTVVEFYCENKNGYHKKIYAVDLLVFTVSMNNAMVMHIFDSRQQLANNSISLFFHIWKPVVQVSSITQFENDMDLFLVRKDYMRLLMIFG
jgi:hypothetical protein